MSVRGMWFTLLPAILLALPPSVSAAPARAQVAGRGQSPLVLPPRDFAEFLAARDLVVDGTVLSADEVRRTPLCTCGITGLGPYRATDLRIAVTRVWHGTAEDSTLIISVLGHPRFSSGPVTAGTRVLAWAVRDCNDGWRLWGEFCVLTANEDIVAPMGASPRGYALLGRGLDRPTTYADLDSALTRRPGLRASHALFDQANDVALLRLVRTTRRDLEGLTFECDSVGWTIGQGGAVPRYIDFPRVPDCYPEIFPGDSLLVPLPAGFTGDRLTIDGCPRAFGVRKGMAIDFGVPVSFLGYALRRDSQGLHVRPFIAKDE